MIILHEEKINYSPDHDPGVKIYGGAALGTPIGMYIGHKIGKKNWA